MTEMFFPEDPLRAILVSVEYGDLLEVTLPRNRHHFAEVMIVTSLNDERSVAAAEANDCRVFRTNAFYEDEAVFNKWKALEQGLDEFGRHGWLCLMDADIVFPQTLSGYFRPDHLYGPVRHLLPSDHPIPPESEWRSLRLYQDYDFAGYTQIFHCNDRWLREHNTPWHQTNWRHAGGGDTFFQNIWPRAWKVRTGFPVLHIGDPGVNWCGRSAPFLDGTSPQNAFERRRKLKEFMRQRQAEKNYDHEKL